MLVAVSTRTTFIISSKRSTSSKDRACGDQPNTPSDSLLMQFGLRLTVVSLGESLSCSMLFDPRRWSRAVSLLIPEQAAPRFRNDGAPLFRLIAARHSD
jgi:hypothetical protein